MVRGCAWVQTVEKRLQKSRPDQVLPRQELAILIVRASGWGNRKTPSPEGSLWADNFQRSLPELYGLRYK